MLALRKLSDGQLDFFQDKLELQIGQLDFFQDKLVLQIFFLLIPKMANFLPSYVW